MSVLLILATGIPVNGAMIAFYLDQNNAGLPDNNYAKVTISDSTAITGDIDFLVEVLTGAFPVQGSNFGMQEFYFNYDDNFDVTESNIINLDPGTWSIEEDRNAGGGFGKFGFLMKGSGNSRVETLSFSIAGVNGDDPWTYAIGNPEMFAAQIADFSGLQGDVDSAKFAGSTLVPIPGSVWLLTSGLIGLVLMRRKK